MGPQRTGQDVYFSVSEAARILGMPRQSVYAAINSGRLRATSEPYGKKIHVQNLLVYGIQAGKSLPELITAIQQDVKAEWQDVLFWLLAGLGVGWLIAKLLGKD